MANRPANTGSGSHRATGPRPVRARDRDEPAVTGVLAWVPYLIVLAGAGRRDVRRLPRARPTRSAAPPCWAASLLAAALARLILPNRFAGVLASRRKTSDVLAFAVLGAAVLAVALSLP